MKKENNELQSKVDDINGSIEDMNTSNEDINNNIDSLIEKIDNNDKLFSIFLNDLSKSFELSKQFNFETKFIQLSGKINSKMPNYVFKKVKDLLKFNKLRALESLFFIIGVSYKKNVDQSNILTNYNFY